MRLRLTAIDEYQFLTCLKNQIWGSKSARFSDWKINDYLGIIVNKEIAGIAQISGKPHKSAKYIWDNGLFPYRISLNFKYVFKKKNRPQILGEIREALVNEWGTRYGWGILNQRLIESQNAEIIYNKIVKNKNDFEEIQLDIKNLLIDAKIERDQNKKDIKSKKRGRPPKKESDKKKLLDLEEQKTSNEAEISSHSMAQLDLINLGIITGCKTWIALNDRKRILNGKPLGEKCIENLPNLGLSEEAKKRISLIDVIWIKQNAPICAFEIETTTSIYSGLLRMSDLLSVVPSINIKLYIIAPKAREEKVLSELSRPTFRKIGLNDYCEFISIELLSELIEKVKGLEGHVQPSILETISLDFSDELKSGLE